MTIDVDELIRELEDAEPGDTIDALPPRPLRLDGLGIQERDRDVPIQLARVEASALDVYVNENRIDEPGPFSYHERPGCYGADDSIPWSSAVESGGRPCGRCCSSFELVSSDDGGNA